MILKSHNWHASCSGRLLSHAFAIETKQEHKKMKIKNLK